MTLNWNLADLFESVADAVPEQQALIIGDRRLSYSELDQRSNRLAHYMADKWALGAGDHVGLYLYNCAEYIEAMLACFKLRAVPININYRFVDQELLYMFDNADLRGAVFGSEFMPQIRKLQPHSPKLRGVLAVDDGSNTQLDSGVDGYEQVLQAYSPQRDFSARSDDDLFILYTGGTTGKPKGVMWPHRDLFLGCFAGLGLYPGITPVTSPAEVGQRAAGSGFYLRSMPLAPLMHGACWWFSCLVLLQGHTLILNPNRSLNGEQVFDIVVREQVNSISFVGDAMALPLLDALRSHPDRWELSQVLSVGSGGAVFSQSVQAEFKKFMPNVVITNSFGSSETGNQGQDDGTERSEGLGRIARDVKADVITDDDRLVQPGSGEIGKLARSGYVAIGYYKDDKKTAESFRVINGKRWVLTGDYATVDADGGIIIYGRGSNCINSGGEKIFPEEVEEAIKAHPAVYDCLVVGSPDPRYTERVAAVVQFRPNVDATLKELQLECRRHIAGYKIPRELHICDTIGRSPSGKPDYKWAKETVEQQQYFSESAPAH